MTHTMSTEKTNKRQAPARLAYGVGELAAMIGVSASFIRLEIVRGKLDTMRAGRRVLITRQSFEKYLVQQG